MFREGVKMFPTARHRYVEENYLNLTPKLGKFTMSRWTRDIFSSISLVSSIVFHKYTCTAFSAASFDDVPQYALLRTLPAALCSYISEKL